MNPLQGSCLENPIDSRAWWTAGHGVAKSRTRLRQLSMLIALLIVITELGAPEALPGQSDSALTLCLFEGARQ